MSEWKSIDSAPIDEAVIVGKWETFGGKLDWRESTGAAWERGFWGRKRTYYGREYSWWKPLPPPPTITPAAPQ